MQSTKKYSSLRLSIVRFLVIGAVGIMVASSAPAQDLPAGPGRETFKRVCTACHDIDSVPRLHYTRADWASLVNSMKDMGADATSAELDEIIDYLAKSFPKVDPAAAKKVNINKAAAQEIETGLGFSATESQAIVQYRTKNGDFKDASGLSKVEGLDPAKIEAAKSKIEY